MRTFLLLISLAWAAFIRGCWDPDTKKRLPSGHEVIIEAGVGAMIVGRDGTPCAPVDSRGYGRIYRCFRGSRAFVGQYVLIGEDYFKGAEVRYVVVNWEPSPAAISYFYTEERFLKAWEHEPWGQEPITWRKCHLEFEK